MTIEKGDTANGTTDLKIAAVIALDPRLAEVWQFLWERDEDEPCEDCHREVVATTLRLAYVQGYADALGESEPGLLYREIGLSSDARPIRRGARRPRRGQAGPGSSDT